MWSPELPHLVTQDTPVTDIAPLPGGPRRRAGWLLAGTAVLLLGGGITASLASGSEELQVGTSVVTDEASRPREVTSTALRLADPEALRAVPTNAGPDGRPASPPL